MSTERCYRYLGDRLTDPALVGRQCTAVRRAMLVLFAGEISPRCVLRRRLRKTPLETAG